MICTVVMGMKKEKNFDAIKNVQKETEMRKFLGVALASAMVFSLAACSGKTEVTEAAVEEKNVVEESSVETETEPLLHEKADGGTFIMPLSADVKELISLITGDDNIWQALSPMWDMMWYETNDGTNFYLAESYEISEDSLDYTVKLVENAKWHDGEPITADDMIFTLDALMTITSGNTISFPNGQTITYEKADDYTVVIHLEEPCGFYSNVLGRMTILPEHIYDGNPNITGSEKNNVGIGSGPYKLVRWNKGESLIYTRNEDYYRGMPNLESIVMKVMPESSVQEIAMQNGEISMMRITNQEQLDKFSDDDNFKIYNFSEARTNVLILRAKDSVLEDIRARQAICYALNIPEIVAASFGSETFAVAANSIFTPLTRYYNPEQTNYVQNLELAKQLAEESGLTGTTLKYGYRTDRVGMEDQALMVQQQLKEIGVECELIAGTFTTSAITNDEIDVELNMMSNGIDSLIGDPGAKSSPLANNDRYERNCGVSAEYRAAWNRAITSVDETERAEAYKELQGLIGECYSFIPTSQPNYVFVASSQFGGLDVHETVMLFQDYCELYQVN